MMITIIGNNEQKSRKLLEDMLHTHGHETRYLTPNDIDYGREPEKEELGKVIAVSVSYFNDLFPYLKKSGAAWIYLATSPSTVDAINAYTHGASKYITLAFNPDALYSELREFLER